MGIKWIPNVSDTGSETFSGTKLFRYWFRDFFRYQIFPISVPKPPNKMKILGTGNSRNRYVTFCDEEEEE